MKTLRTFIAVELDQELRAKLRDLQDQLDSQVAPRSVRWVRPEGIHLTLKFLGDTPLDRIEGVKDAVSRAAGSVRPFTLVVCGLGCVPKTRRPRVGWVGLQEVTGNLSQLKRAVETEVAPLGFPTEKRAFHPHLTLGRVNRRASKSEVREIGEIVASIAIGTLDEMEVTAVSYIQSDLLPSGAVYTNLHEVHLGRR